MDIKSLTEIIRLVREKEPFRRIIIFGSTSLLASVPDEVAAALGIEMTLDTDLFLDPDDAEIRMSLDKLFGEDHTYHRETGYYADFVDLRLSENFPTGWTERLVPFSELKNVFALSPVDAAVTKLMATAHSRLLKRLGRCSTDRGSKDISTIVAIIQSGYATIDAIQKLLDTVDLEPSMLVESAAVMTQIEHQLGGA